MTLAEKFSELIAAGWEKKDAAALIDSDLLPFSEWRELYGGAAEESCATN